MGPLSVKLSPDGSRLTWSLQSKEGYSLFDRFTERALPALDWSHPRNRCALWISGSNGSHLHEIGRIEAPWQSPESVRLGIGFANTLNWTQDSQQVTLLMNDNLVFTPAD